MHHDRETPSFFRLWQLIVVVAWVVGLWFLCARIDGTPFLNKFLRPDYAWIVHMGVAILVLFLISLVYCDPHRRGRRGAGLVLQMTIMVLPLLYLPTAVRSELSPDAARKRAPALARTDTGAASRPFGQEFRSGTTEAAQAPKLPDDPSLIQLITEGSAYRSKRVTTMGRVCLDDRLPANTFFCYRLLMICCAADARPVGILVHHDKIDTLKNGAWVQVTGSVELGTFEKHDVVKIDAERVEPTAPPRIPYVLP